VRIVDVGEVFQERWSLGLCGLDPQCEASLRV
jgi:hypothetical protein